MKIFFDAFAGSDLFGKLIFLLLFFLSAVSWYVLLHKISLLRSIRKKASDLQESLEKQSDRVLDLPLDEASLPSGILHPFADIYTTIKAKTIEILDKNSYFSEPLGSKGSAIFLSKNDVDLIGHYADGTITAKAKILEKNLFILATAISLAPFLGILGTVWGILLSLGELQKGASVHSNSVILSGLSTALATTVLGLVIAIPALVAYNYLKSAFRSFYVDMEDFSHFILSTIEMQYRRVDVTETLV